MAVPPEIYEALKHLSSTNRALHDARIRQEYRFGATIITFFTLCAAAKLAGKIPSTGTFFVNMFSIFDLVICICFGITVFFTWLYLKTSAASNKENQSRAEIAEDVVRCCITKNDDIIGCELFDEFKKRYEIKDHSESHPSRWRWLLEACFITLWALFSAALIIFT